MKFLVPIDLTKNELQNAVIQNLASAPGSPVDGQIYYDTTDDTFKVYENGVWHDFIPLAQKAAANGVASLNGSSLVVQNPANAQTTPAGAKIPLADGGGKIANGWLNTGTGNGLDADTVDGQHASALLARANHTGTQTAATISDFDTQVRTSRLDQMAAPTAAVSMNSQKITNLDTPTNPQDATNKAYVDGLVNGVEIHPSVRAATTANITLSAPQTIDGVSVIAGNRVLVKNQSDPEDNGIYVVAAGAWARASDADTWAELISAFVFVEEGTTLEDTAWVSTVDDGGTLNTDPVVWTQFAAPGSTSASNVGTGVGVYDGQVGSDLQFRSILAASSKIDVALVSDDITIDVDEAALTLDNIGGTRSISKGGTGQTSAAAAIVALGGTRKFAASVGNGVLTSIAVNHALNTTDVVVMVKQVASPFAVVYPDVEVTDANNVTVIFTVAPTTNQYRVIVIG
jgi:hypothetical protein